MTIWTVGHSRHQLPALLAVLRGPGVELVADIRSRPFSRYNPQFNRERFGAALSEAGLGYLFLGAELGGRPPEPEFYDGDGHVRYVALASTERFTAGLRGCWPSRSGSEWPCCAARKIRGAATGGCSSAGC